MVASAIVVMLISPWHSLLPFIPIVSYCKHMRTSCGHRSVLGLPTESARRSEELAPLGQPSADEG